MRNPVYFNYGIAVHGAFQVPQDPASHGCIRIDNSFSEHFQSIVAIGEPVFVWDGVEEPEVYGAQSGLWDWADPNYTHDDARRRPSRHDHAWQPTTTTTCDADTTTHAAPAHDHRRPTTTTTTLPPG